MPKLQTYAEASEYQLSEWVEGRPWHNPVERWPNDGGECCPDFSCCDPELLADENLRQKFAAANGDARHEMLMMFLGAMIAKSSDKKVHIAGDVPRDVQ